MTPTRDLIDRLASLGDENRLRLLMLLDRHEFTVTELTSVAQLPQSTVSRHLKVLSGDGWIRSRQDGTSRFYRMSTELDPDAAELWAVSRRALRGAPWEAEDAERARVVLAERRSRSEEFFSESASRWDEVRTDLFGGSADMSALFGLLEPDWVVGDLGAGTGALTEKVAPFVSRVIAIDRSPEMLDAARTRFTSVANAEVHEGELESLPVETGTFDLALMVLVLHYVVDPQRVLDEAHRSLKPGGRLVVVDMRRHGRDEYRQTMGHLWPGFGKKQMNDWADAAGFARYRHAGLQPDPEAAGPLLFVGTATK